MRDVMCLAMPTPRPEELARIYEWYAARTTSAIRTSYAAATAAVGALLTYIEHGTEQPWTIVAFGAVIALGLLACLLQHSELAQLPRERAVAMHLLTTFEQLAKAEPPVLEGPIVQPERPQPTATRCRVVVTIIVMLIVPLFAVALRNERSHLALAGLALFTPVIFAFAHRIAAEIRPTPEFPSDTGTLVEQIGGVRLDDYISDPVITGVVNERIESAIRNTLHG